MRGNGNNNGNGNYRARSFNQSWAGGRGRPYNNGNNNGNNFNNSRDEPDQDDQPRGPRLPVLPPLPRGPGGSKSLQIARTPQQITFADLWEEYFKSWTWGIRQPVLRGFINFELFKPQLEDLLETCKQQVTEALQAWLNDQRVKELHSQNGTKPNLEGGTQAGLTPRDITIISKVVAESIKEANLQAARETKTAAASGTSPKPLTD